MNRWMRTRLVEIVNLVMQNSIAIGIGLYCILHRDPHETLTRGNVANAVTPCKQFLTSGTFLIFNLI